MCSCEKNGHVPFNIKSIFFVLVSARLWINLLPEATIISRIT